MAGIDALLVLALEHRVTCDQLPVLEDAHLGRMVLDLDDPAPGGVRDAVLIAANGNHALMADPPLDGQHRVVGPSWQGYEVRLLIRKVLVDNLLRGCMDPGVGYGNSPLLKLGIEVVEVTETAPQKEVLPHVTEWALDLALRLRPIRLAGATSEAL